MEDVNIVGSCRSSLETVVFLKLLKPHGIKHAGIIRKKWNTAFEFCWNCLMVGSIGRDDASSRAP
eukprot:scaffold160928_cov29-Attheya_sp.AAC.2